MPARSGGSCHGIDVNMWAEAEGARLLAEVEEEGLDEVSFFSAGNRDVFRFLQLSPISPIKVVTMFQ